MSSAIRLIVGLANPGEKYAETRHNAGAWLVEALAITCNTPLRPEAKYHGEHAIVKLHGETCHLLIPSTYMNLSGQAVSACMRYHKIPSDAVLIVHDEIDLPPGIIRLKFDGGHGGHNGLQDIISHLGTRQFYRLRIGVGHPGNSKDVSDYVLGRPSKSDRLKIDDAITRAQDTLPLIMDGNIQKAMQSLHSD